jgi:hypothetical protein
MNSTAPGIPDATLLIPTHRHGAFLPVALRSALAQRSASVEIFVVGAGVDDATREAIRPFLGDVRVRFFDLPKGERLGEHHRHQALLEAKGEIVCYLSDDDVLFPGHVVEMKRLLAKVDFAHSTPVIVHPNGVLEYRPADLARAEFLALIREGRNNFIGLTGAAHTRAAYDRLPHGWRPAPAGKPTDIYMWQQFADLPRFRGATATRLTAVSLPDPAWRAVDDVCRAAVLEHWLTRSQLPGGEDEIQRLLEGAVWRAAQDFKLRSIYLSRELECARRDPQLLQTALWKKAARKLTRYEPFRTLRKRLRPSREVSE